VDILLPSHHRVLLTFYWVLNVVSPGKLLAVLVNGLSDRNSGVRKSYALAIGCLAKVVLLVLFGIAYRKNTLTLRFVDTPETITLCEDFRLIFWKQNRNIML